jgi:hypothetical protein
VVEKKRKMSLQYDSARKTAMDSASGLGVEFLENDHPQEAQSVFRLYWNGQAYLFTVHYDFGYNDLARAYPGISNAEVLNLIYKKNTITYFPGLAAAIPDKSIVLDRVDIFLELLALVLRDQWSTKNVHIVFAPLQVDKSLHRDLRYPPVRAPI